MEKMSANKRYNMFKLLFFTVYFADALFYSYTSLFLSNLGFQEGTIGTIASVTTICCLVANPIWNIFAKNSARIKKMLMAVTFLSGIIILLYANASSLEFILLFTGLLAMTIAPLYAFLDGEAVFFCKLNDKDYAGVRVAGSISYIFGSTVGGLLVNALGFVAVFSIAGAIFSLSSVAVFFFVPKRNLLIESKPRNFKAVFGNLSFWLYLCFYIFMVSLNTVGDSFVSLLFCKEKGLETAQYGWISGGIIAAEVVTMLLLGRLYKSKKILPLYVFAGCVFFLRCFILSFVQLPLGVLIAASLLRGVAWGTVLYVHMRYLVGIVGVENVTTAALILVACSNLFQFAASNLMGLSFEHMGYSFSYRLIAVISFSACVLYALTRIIWDKKKEKQQQNPAPPPTAQA